MWIRFFWTIKVKMNALISFLFGIVVCSHSDCCLSRWLCNCLFMLQPTSTIIDMKDLSQHSFSHSYNMFLFPPHLSLRPPTLPSSVKYSLAVDLQGGQRWVTLFSMNFQGNSSKLTCPLQHPWPNHMLMYLSLRVKVKRNVLQHGKVREAAAGGVGKDTALSAVWTVGSCDQSHVAMKQGLLCHYSVLRCFFNCQWLICMCQF